MSYQRMNKLMGFKSFPKKIRIKDEAVLDQFRLKPCEICGLPSDPAHIGTRGSGADDIPSGLISFCRVCHVMQGQIGWSKLCARYPYIESILNSKGWVFEYVGDIKKLKRM